MLLECVWSLHTLYQPCLGRFSLLSPTESFPLGPTAEKGLRWLSLFTHVILVYWAPEQRLKQFYAFSCKHSITMTTETWSDLLSPQKWYCPWRFFLLPLHFSGLHLPAPTHKFGQHLCLVFCSFFKTIGKHLLYWNVCILLLKKPSSKFAGAII